MIVKNRLYCGHEKASYAHGDRRYACSIVHLQHRRFQGHIVNSIETVLRTSNVHGKVLILS